MDSGYKDLSNFYDFLFPVSEDLKTFLRPLIQPDRYWLDVGCGTGLLLEWLKEQDVNGWGLEPDEGFLVQAHKRINSEKIFQGGMESLDSIPFDFDIITCLGNVLAHLKDEKGAKTFIEAAYKKLNPSGKLLIQIVNFDKALSEKKQVFPVIERITPEGIKLKF